MTDAAPNTDYKGELVELDAVEQALAGLREQYGTVPDVRTKDGYALCKKGVRELTSYRTSTDKLRKAITQPHRDFIDRVNAYGKDLVEKLREIEQPLKDAKQHEDERAEREKQERIAKLRHAIDVNIWSFLDTAEGLDSTGLAELHDAATQIDVEGYFDLTTEAEDAKAQVLAQLSERHGQALERERLAADQAELDAERRRLREEAEQREADQRELEALRREKAERDRIRLEEEAKAQHAAWEAESKRQAEEAAKRKPAPQPEPQPEPLPAAAETVTITRAEYNQLLADQAALRALEAMGVDNWSGYADAMQQLAA